MLYQITTQGTCFGQQIINRWNYSSAGIPAAVSGSFALAYAFGVIPRGTPTPSIPLTEPFGYTMGQLSAAYQVNTVIVEALYDVEDFYERPFPTPFAGLQTDEPMSPLAAYGFRTNRVRTDIDRGTKRLTGVIETQVDAGGIIDPTWLASNLTNVALQWSRALTYDDEGNTITFTPCVLSKEEYTTPSGKRAYRRPCGRRIRASTGVARDRLQSRHGDVVVLLPPSD